MTSQLRVWILSGLAAASGLFGCADHLVLPKAPTELHEASPPTPRQPERAVTEAPPTDAHHEGERHGPVVIGEKVPLGIETQEPHAVPGAPPSAAHPRGTLYVAWGNTSPSDVGAYLGEWDIEAGVFLSKKRTRDCDLVCDVRIARSGASVVLASQARDVLSIEVFDATLTSRGRTELDRSESGMIDPVLDADERFIVVGKWVEQPPVKAAVSVGDYRVQPHEALSVYVVDAKTSKVLGSRLFRGDHLLMPFSPWRRHRPLRIDTQQGSSAAFIGLPEERRAIVQRVSLPSLKTEAERVIPNLDLTRASVDLEPLGARGVLVTSLRSYTTLTSKLAPSGQEAVRESLHLVFDASRGSLVAAGEAPGKIGAVPVIAGRVVPSNSGEPILAFGQHLLLQPGETPSIALISGNPPKSASPTKP